MSDAPLSLKELESKLSRLLEPVLTSRRSVTDPALELFKANREQQDFVMYWAEVICGTNTELAYQFVTHVNSAFQLMSLEDTKAWVVHAMDIYDSLGLYPANGVLNEVDVYAAESAVRQNGVGYNEVAGVLEHFVRGLSGRALKLQPADHIYSDSEVLHLPYTLSVLSDRQLNFSLYKAMLAHQWAQGWYGTFLNVADEQQGANAILAKYKDQQRATALLHALESFRLDACISRDLPGLHREMQQLQQEVGEVHYPDSWSAHIDQLRKAEATLADSYIALAEIYPRKDPIPNLLCYQGELRIDEIEAVTLARVQREKEELGQALARIAEELEGDPDEQFEGDRDQFEQAKKFKIKETSESSASDGYEFELEFEGRRVEPPAGVKALLQSLLQDFGVVPDDHLITAGRVNDQNAVGNQPPDLGDGLLYEQEVIMYPEWDYRRQHYRKSWCTLREIDLEPVDQPFVRNTLTKYAGLVTEIRKTFEVLRGDQKLLRKQKNGDDIDIDAVVEAYVEMETGEEMSDRLFTKLHKMERDMAVVFMVDASGSTKGWINEAERESLVLLCEALEILGDRYAIYGFSGATRKRCELYRVKRLDEPYGDLVKGRIAGFMPMDYTRMGVIIRHLTEMLNNIEARTKLLITLSDGKPDDYDGYRGEYGIEDTRQALMEAKNSGIHPFCVTIDNEAHAYLPHMYGAVNYTVIDNVRKLPLKISDIYRRLTS